MTATAKRASQFASKLNINTGVERPGSHQRSEDRRRKVQIQPLGVAQQRRIGTAVQPVAEAGNVAVVDPDHSNAKTSAFRFRNSVETVTPSLIARNVIINTDERCHLDAQASS
jgi:hypothetical protein